MEILVIPGVLQFFVVVIALALFTLWIWNRTWSEYSDAGDKIGANIFGGVALMVVLLAAMNSWNGIVGPPHTSEYFDKIAQDNDKDYVSHCIQYTRPTALCKQAIQVYSFGKVAD